jgi:hypothetical protein
MHRLTAAAATLIALMLAAPAFAQGSAGGSIGKRDKSISRAHERRASPPPRAPTARKAARRSSSDRPEKRASCGNFFGVWTSGGGSWLYGENDTTFNADGTARHLSGIQGTWTCEHGEIVLVWINWDNDRLKLSGDGKRLNSLAGGKGFSRK